MKKGDTVTYLPPADQRNNWPFKRFIGMSCVIESIDDDNSDDEAMAQVAFAMPDGDTYRRVVFVRNLKPRETAADSFRKLNESADKALENLINAYRVFINTNADIGAIRVDSIILGRKLAHVQDAIREFNTFYPEA